MLTKSSPISTQSNLFHSELFSQLDVKDPLIQLANTINWTVFDDATFNAYTLPKVHQLGGITRHTWHIV
jgi:hypothetical protein